MSASSWRYYTPYRADPEAALQELRQRVFAEGDYSMGGGGFTKVNQTGGPARPQPAGGMRNPIDMLRSGAFGPMDPTTERVVRAAESGDFSHVSGPERQAAEQMRAMLNLLGAVGRGPRLFEPAPPDPDGDDRPESIEELLELVAEDGTHSVLDIEGVVARRQFGAAAPLAEKHYTRVFGSDRPTREQVEANWARLADRLERWEAYYVTVYRDGVPAEYAFIGCSGD